MKIVRLVMEWLLLLLFVLILFNFRLVDYGLMQLRGQLNLVFKSRPVNEVLTDPTVPDSVKAKLNYIREVERFCVDSLGMTPTRNYQSYFDQHGKPLLWVVTACEPYRLVAYSWDFPFLGRVSYKGFFSSAKADQEAKALAALGYDIDRYDVGAWSTLGWLPDPVLSGMLRRDEGRLAELIVHELTHATLYVKGDVDFNENLASFVGEQGALRFLAVKFGESSPESLKYVHRLEDDKKLTQHMVNGAAALERLYASDPFVKNDVSRPALKQVMLDSIALSVDTISFADTLRFKKPAKRSSWNNAHFLSYLRYDARKEQMKAEMDSLTQGDIRQYLQYLKKSYGKGIGR